jgi:hypothetical protein
MRKIFWLLPGWQAGQDAFDRSKLGTALRSFNSSHGGVRADWTKACHSTKARPLTSWPRGGAMTALRTVVWFNRPYQAIG